MFVLFMLAAAAVAGPSSVLDGQAAFVRDASLPRWVLDFTQSDEFTSKYDVSVGLNPFYQRGDFNGDGQMDLAVLVRAKGTGKTGISVFHRGEDRYHVLAVGAELSVRDDLSWMDAWQVYEKQPVEAGAGSTAPAPVLRGEALHIEQTEAVSAILYWDGTEYRWYQQGD